MYNIERLKSVSSYRDKGRREEGSYANIDDVRLRSKSLRGPMVSLLGTGIPENYLDLPGTLPSITTGH